MKKRTKTTIDDLSPQARPYRVYDAELKVFSVRVGPSGDKRWQVEYRPINTEPGTYLGLDDRRNQSRLGRAPVVEREQLAQQRLAGVLRAGQKHSQTDCHRDGVASGTLVKPPGCPGRNILCSTSQRSRAVCRQD